MSEWVATKFYLDGSADPTTLPLDNSEIEIILADRTALQNISIKRGIFKKGLTKDGGSTDIRDHIAGMNPLPGEKWSIQFWRYIGNEMFTNGG